MTSWRTEASRLPHVEPPALRPSAGTVGPRFVFWSGSEVTLASMAATCSGNPGLYCSFLPRRAGRARSLSVGVCSLARERPY